MTEVTVERMFSHLNFILDERRSCLKGEILDDILFLRMNSKFMDIGEMKINVVPVN
jgi:predicted component of viral defense system (DUF524 family)